MPKTIQVQCRLRRPLQGRQPQVAQTHPGQARRSARKRGLQTLRKEPTGAQLAEATAYRKERRPTPLTLTDGYIAENGGKPLDPSRR